MPPCWGAIKCALKDRFHIFICVEPFTGLRHPMPPRALAKWRREAYLPKEPIGGRTGFDGDVETGAAGRGAAGLVKSGNKSNCQQRLRLRLRCLITARQRPPRRSRRAGPRLITPCGDIYQAGRDRCPPGSSARRLPAGLPSCAWSGAIRTVKAILDLSL